MRIVILGPAYPLRGGIAKHTGSLYRSLEKNRHQPILVSFRKQFPRFLFPGTTQVDISEIADKIPAKPLFIPWNPLSWMKTASYIGKLAPDILLCVWWTPFTALGYASVCALFRGKKAPPILFLLHNVIPHEKLPAMKTLTRLALKSARGFIAQSKKVEGELLEFFPSAAGRWRRVTPHPTYDFQNISSPPREEARAKLGITESRTLLYFGVVRRYKGLMTLLQAFPKVAQHFEGDIRLLVAGEFYDSPQPYLEEIENSGFANRISLHNRFIPNEEVGYFFAAADAVALPYSSASQSGVTQTAFGYGLPVVSTRVGGLPEVITHGKTGMICPPDNPAALADTIIQFYRIRGDVDWAGNIEREKSRFSWDNLVRAVENFASEVRD